MAETVSEGFQELLNRLRLTADQKATASSRSSGIKEFFADEFVMAETVKTMGSYSRSTLVRWERDIDLLAPLSYRTYKDSYDDDPKGMLYWVRDKLNDGYATTTVSTKKVAIKLDFSVIAADVVPCFTRNGGGYLMHNGVGGWRSTNPPFHTDLIVEQDKTQANYLRPLIKLTKAWNIANSGHLQSFHIELMVARMWKGRDLATPAWSALMAKTLKALPGWVADSFYDPWGPGGRIDDYLTNDTRAKVIRMLNDDARAAEDAEAYRLEGKTEKAFERWDVIYRQKFPAYG